MSRQRILVVEDDANLGRVITLLLESEGYAVTTVGSAEDALAHIADCRPQFVLSDLKLPGLDGFALLGRIQARWPGLPVAMVSAHADIQDALQATRAGAVDFLVKPLGRAGLIGCIRKHLPGSEGASWRDGIDTRSPLMESVIEGARTAAATDVPVLLTGASGTGKEVLARAMHRASRRAGGPFVAINCAALPPALLESELFGHVRGAFTGAVGDHPGLFRAAHGGTIFLDEIGDMPLPLQAKLLRVLQEREVRPVGSARNIPVDVRVLSATHRHLPERMAAGAFRTDLYYRLGVLVLQLPTLHERREDIPLLARKRLAQLAANGAPRRVLPKDAMDLLSRAAWPGNVRQLLNVVERCAALAEGRVIDAALVERCAGAESTAGDSFDAARTRFSKEYLRELLARAGGNMTRAAQLAGRNRTDLYKLLERHGLDAATLKELKEEQGGHRPG